MPSTKRVLFHEILDVAGRDAAVLSHSRDRDHRGRRAGHRWRPAGGGRRSDVEVSDVTRLVGGCTMMPGTDAAQQRRMLRLVLDGLRVSP